MNSKRIITTLVFVVITASIMLSIFIFENEESFDIRYLASGTEANITINLNEENYANSIVNNHGANITVRNLGRLLNGNPVLYDFYVQSIKDFHFNHIRYPGGCDVAWYNWKNPDDSPYSPIGTMEDIFNLAKDTHTEIIFEMSSLGFLDPSIINHTYTNPCGNEVIVRWSDSDIRNFVREYSVRRKNDGDKYIKIYELGNEEWGYWNSQLGRYLTPAEYIYAAKQVSQIIKEEAPFAKVIGVSAFLNGEVWGGQEYRNNSQHFDQITMHNYWHDRYWTDAPEGESLFTLDWQFAAFIDEYQDEFQGIEKFQSPAITEYNLFCWKESTTNRPHRNTSYYENGLYILGALIKQLENNILISTIHNGDLPYNPPESQVCSHLWRIEDDKWINGVNVYAFDILNNHVKDTHIQTTIDSPDVTIGEHSFESLIGSSSRDSHENVSLVLLNRNPQDSLTTTISLDNFPDNVIYDMYTLSANEFSSKVDEISFSKTVSQKTASNGFEITVPKMSSVVLEIKAKETDPPPDPPPDPSRTHLKINLELFKNANNQSDSVLVKLYDNNTIVKEITTRTDTNGYTPFLDLGVIDSKEYDVFVKPSGYLSQSKSISLSTGNNSYSFTNAFKGGDIQETSYDFINALDFSLFIKYLREIDLKGDFDSNGTVNAIDYSIILKSYREQYI